MSRVPADGVTDGHDEALNGLEDEDDERMSHPPDTSEGFPSPVFSAATIPGRLCGTRLVDCAHQLDSRAGRRNTGAGE